MLLVGNLMELNVILKIVYILLNIKLDNILIDDLINIYNLNVYQGCIIVFGMQFMYWKKLGMYMFLEK